MLSSVVKYGVLILISMSVCVYADEQVCILRVCNKICPLLTGNSTKRCNTSCDRCRRLLMRPIILNMAFNNTGSVTVGATEALSIRTTAPDVSNAVSHSGSVNVGAAEALSIRPPDVSKTVSHQVCDGSKIIGLCKMAQDYCRQCEITQDVTSPESSTTTPTITGNGENEANEVSDNGDNCTCVKAAIGSVLPVAILIGLAIIIWYFMKKKLKKGTKPQSVSYNVDNICYGTTDEIHSKEISENNHVDIDVGLHNDSQYNTLHDTTTETHEYAYAGYPGDSEHQNKPTVYADVSNDSPEYYVLQKEQETDATELTSDVKVKHKDIDTLKQNGSQSEYMCLQHDASTTRNAPPPATQSQTDAEYDYASYPQDCRDQSKPTECAKVSKDLPVYYTLQKEQESDVTELTSDVEVKTKDIDTLKQNGSQSEYMCLQHDAVTTTNAPPPATQNEDDAEYTYAIYPEDCRDQSKPTGCVKVSNDLPEYYTPKKDQDNDVTRLNITSLQNDDAYAELRLDGNYSNEDSYNTLNRLARINVPDDVTDDYNKLIATPAFDEESEEYSHLNRTLTTDESVTDHGYGKLELPTEPAARSIKPTAKANDGYEETLPNLPNDDTRDVNSPII